MPLDAARTVVSVVSVVAFILLVMALSRPRLARARLFRASSTAQPTPDPEHTQSVLAAQTQSAMTATFVLATAYVLGAPYALPWYDVLTWATLPLLLATTLSDPARKWLTVMAMGFMRPGRVVAMSPDVESPTLGLRKIVGPSAAAGWYGWLSQT